MRVIQTPASRLNDPETSYDAERFVNESGIRTAQQKHVYDLVRMYPDYTSDELADVPESTLDRYQIARRLKELETAAMIKRSEGKRASRHSGRPGLTWRATKPQLNLFEDEA